MAVSVDASKKAHIEATLAKAIVTITSYLSTIGSCLGVVCPDLFSTKGTPTIDNYPIIGFSTLYLSVSSAMLIDWRIAFSGESSYPKAVKVLDMIRSGVFSLALGGNGVGSNASGRCLGFGMRGSTFVATSLASRRTRSCREESSTWPDRKPRRRGRVSSAEVCSYDLPIRQTSVSLQRWSVMVSMLSHVPKQLLSCKMDTQLRVVT